MAALNEDVMNREYQFFQLLGKAKRALFSDAELAIECQGEKSIKLVFTPLMK